MLFLPAATVVCLQMTLSAYHCVRLIENGNDDVRVPNVCMILSCVGLTLIKKTFTSHNHHIHFISEINSSLL